MANAMTFGHRLEELTDGVTVFRDGVGKPMPLISTDFDIQISSGLAIVVATRKFLNSEDVPIEAILTMPVGFNAVVTGLSAQIDGRKLRAVAKSKSAARARYEGAIDRGKMAVLHEEVLRGIHVLSVGQLAPGKEVSVELITVLPLTLAGADPFLRIPVTTGQLYGATPLKPADDLITDRTVKHVGSLRVRTDAGVAMLDGKKAIEPGQTTEITLNKAIELVVVGGQFGSLIGRSANGQQVRLDLRPTRGGAQPLKLAILVDRSGSTNSTLGNRTATILGAMKRGLADALTKLQDHDYIALWQFSDDCQRLGTGAGREVLQLLKKLNQPGGGTNLGSAIQKVAATGVRDILVLTDGQTWDKLHLLAGMNVRVSAMLVGKGSLDANIGHFCAMTGGDLYYAPDANVAPAVRLALHASRSGLSEKKIVVEAGKPVSMSRTIGGVDVTASWSDAMEIGVDNDIGRFAAGICLSMVSEKEAEELAVVEGLCSHLTSLVLVDEAGEKTDGVSETRKVPLMAEEDEAESMFDVDDDADSQLGDFIEDRNAILPLDSPRPMMAAYASPRQQRMRFGLGSLVERPQENSSALDQSTRSVSQSRSVAELKGLALERARSRAAAQRQLRAYLELELDDQEAEIDKGISLEELVHLAESIDWEGNVGSFLADDFSGLLDDERDLLARIMLAPEATDILKLSNLLGQKVLLAWLSMKFVTHSKAAKSFAEGIYLHLTPETKIGLEKLWLRE